jgi:hypothetical protein
MAMDPPGYWSIDPTWSPPSRPAYVTPPRGGDHGRARVGARGYVDQFTPPATILWPSSDTNEATSPPSTSTWDTPPNGSFTSPRAREGGRRGKTRWSPERPKKAHWGAGTTRVLAPLPSPRAMQQGNQHKATCAGHQAPGNTQRGPHCKAFLPRQLHRMP